MIKKIDLQRTLAESISLKGIGLHTGVEVTLTFKEAPENTGLVFVRKDLDPPISIPALATYVAETERGTTLEKEGVKVHTTEHLLAALVGAQIDNCILELDAEEVPILDGSSKEFVEAIAACGIQEQKAPREVFVPQKPIAYHDEASGSELLMIPADKTSYSVMIDFNTKVLGSQNATLEQLDDFKTDIAPSRTFSFLHELEQLLAHGLIKGGDLNNAIVYVDKPLAESTMQSLKKAFGKSEIAVKPNGILDNLTLHFPNEAARHKLLDVMGDLALIGMPVQAKIIATKPGHKINTTFAKQVNMEIKENRRNEAPLIDFSKPPIKDVNGIMEMLPHRPPFLLVDKIFELSDTHVVGIKNVTMNEPFFVGHFPGEPVMPGVLQIEAMAQCGGILLLSTVPNPDAYLTFFMKIDKVRFKRPVNPGDTLVFKLDLLSPIRRGICHMSGKAFVNGQLVSEGELMAQMIKKDKVKK